jgi:FkbM family methyltransferase
VRLAVVVIGDGDAARASASAEAAWVQARGSFSEMMLLPPAGEGGEALREAASAALAAGCDWLLALDAAETARPDLLTLATPALPLFDAIWGGASSPADPAKPQQRTRLAAQDLPTFFHAALAWWIGPSHFVRPAAALAALRDAASPAWRAAYWLSLWRGGRPYKTAQALTVAHGPLPELAEADRARLIGSLQAEPVFMPVRQGPHALRLPYTGLNPVIEREQARGLFFEQEELSYLAARFPAGLRIVDAGANTGNHTLFFAAVMQASVVPLEPHPRAGAALRAAMRENGLANVDLTKLGIAVGAEPGRLRTIESPGGGLGATRFVADPRGPVAVQPLDALIDGPVDLVKIDVEGMEMAVLAGARRLITAHRPALFIEVLDATLPAFLAWTEANAYRVEKLFPDKTHCNYLLVPAERS